MNLARLLKLPKLRRHDGLTGPPPILRARYCGKTGKHGNQGCQGNSRHGTNTKFHPISAVDRKEAASDYIDSPFSDAARFLKVA